MIKLSTMKKDGIALLRDPKALYKGYQYISGILHGEESDKLIHYIEQMIPINADKSNLFEHPSKHILYSSHLQAFKYNNRTPLIIEDQSEISKLLKPLQKALDGSLLSSAMITIPTQMKQLLDLNPWDALVDICPISLLSNVELNKQTQSNRIPFFFARSGVSFIGWQTQEWLLMMFDCEYQSTWKFTGSKIEKGPIWASHAGEDQYGCYADLDVNGVIQRFRWIEEGTFWMGSEEKEIGRRNNYYYQDNNGLFSTTFSKNDDNHYNYYDHNNNDYNNNKKKYDYEVHQEITLTKGFWLADSTCTQALWEKVVGNNPAYFKEKNNPAEEVSWEDAQIFLQTLNQQISGLKARLPSEEEWEYSCRAGTTTPFSFGENITPYEVNYNGGAPYNDAPKSLYRERTIAVKSLPANPWGLYEMHGNVWEWCQDRYSSLNPDRSNERIKHALRGGSWRNGGNCRSATRRWLSPEYHDNKVGFRFIVSP